MKYTSLIILLLATTACTVHQSDGRKCIEGATNTCQLDQYITSSILEEKGVNHCNYTDTEVSYWRSDKLTIPSDYSDLRVQAWVNYHIERDQKFISLKFTDMNCIFETTNEQSDLIKLLDQSDELRAIK